LIGGRLCLCRCVLGREPKIEEQEPWERSLTNGIKRVYFARTRYIFALRLQRTVSAWPKNPHLQFPAGL